MVYLKYKKLKTAIFILVIDLIFFFCPVLVKATTFNFNIEYQGYGFSSTRSTSKIGVDRIKLPSAGAECSIPLKSNKKLIVGYVYDNITQSRVYTGLYILKKGISAKFGASAGFYNELPLKLIPGIFGRFYFYPGKHICIKISGHTSLFINSIFSLKSADYGFDQNTAEIGLFYYDDTIMSGIAYNSTELYRRGNSTTFENSIKDIELIVKTIQKNTIFNAITKFGFSRSYYSSTTVKNEFLQLFIDQSVPVKLKGLILNPGIRINILNFNLKDLKSINPPSVPNFTFHFGLSLMGK